MTYTGITLSEDDAITIKCILNNEADIRKARLESLRGTDTEKMAFEQYLDVMSTIEHFADECSKAIDRRCATCEVESLAES